MKVVSSITSYQGSLTSHGSAQRLDRFVVLDLTFTFVFVYDINERARIRSVSGGRSARRAVSVAIWVTVPNRGQVLPWFPGLIVDYEVAFSFRCQSAFFCEGSPSTWRVVLDVEVLRR